MDYMCYVRNPEGKMLSWYVENGDSHNDAITLVMEELAFKLMGAILCTDNAVRPRWLPPKEISA